MEVSIQTSDGVEVINDIIDCIADGSEYVLTTTENKTLAVEGTLLGATTYVVKHPSGWHGDSIAVKLATDKPLDVPPQPLSTSSELDDDEWEYEDGFEFYPPELECNDDSCILRNVSVIAHQRAEAVAEKKDVFQIYADEGGLTTTESVSADGPYQVSFNSGWISALLDGQITRLTSYIEDDSYKMKLAPIEETRGQVSWAF